MRDEGGKEKYHVDVIQGLELPIARPAIQMLSDLMAMKISLLVGSIAAVLVMTFKCPRRVSVTSGRCVLVQGPPPGWECAAASIARDGHFVQDDEASLGMWALICDGQPRRFVLSRSLVWSGLGAR